MKIENRVVTIGSDPECFVFQKKMGGERLVPAFEFLPSKQEADSRMYWDGFQAEWSHGVAYSEIQHHRAATRGALVDLLDRARAHAGNVALSTANVVPVETEGFRTEYVILGCKPSMNAYGLYGNDPGDPFELKIRFSGGHVHLGIPNLTNAMRVRVVKVLDAILGVWATVRAAYENEGIGVNRRLYYGLPGEYRPTKYGLEYRVLSSFWLQSPELHDQVFNLAVAAANFAMSRNYKKWEASEALVISTIRFGDADTAARILRTNGTLFAQLTCGMNIPTPLDPPTKGSLEKAWGIAA